MMLTPDQFEHVDVPVPFGQPDNKRPRESTAVAGTRAQMTTPAPGSTSTASAVQFQWTGGTVCAHAPLIVRPEADDVNGSGCHS